MSSRIGAADILKLLEVRSRVWVERDDEESADGRSVENSAGLEEPGAVWTPAPSSAFIFLS